MRENYNTPRRKFLGTVGAAGLTLSAGCSGDDDEAYEFTAGTAPQGVPAFTHGQALQAMVREHGEDIRYTGQRTDGFESNIGLMLDGEFNLINTYPGLYDLAARGEEMFDEAHGTFGYFGPSEYLLDNLMVTRADSDIEYYEDLVGRTAATFPTGTGVQSFSQIFLNTIGITRDDYDRQDVPLGDYASALETGRVDAVGWFSFNQGDIVSADYQEVEAQNEIRPLKLTEENLEKAREEPALSMTETQIQGSKHFSDIETTNWALTSVQIIDTDAPAEAVYELAELMVEHKDELLDSAPTFIDFTNPDLFTSGIHDEYPVHPGFEEFLKDQGWWDDEWEAA